MGGVLALIALVLEVIHWATTKDASLSFYALVLITLALVVPVGMTFYNSHRGAA